MLVLLVALLAGASTVDSGSPGAVAKLAILQGPIELSGATQAPKAGDDVDAGVTIKTPAGSRASFDFPDGCELRVNENTEVSIEGPKKIDLKLGRIFVKIVKAGARFDINTEHVQISSNQSLLDIEFKPRVPNGPPAGTFIRVLEGTAKA
ncbi:MAG TPA: FecR family protein, partial [Planctomycetota bacterium]|nr:FecR family protein [Planctomycetota bacterium]